MHYKIITALTQKLGSVISSVSQQKNESDTGNNIMKFVIILIVIFAFLLIIPIMVISLPGIMVKGNFHKKGETEIIQYSGSVKETYLHQLSSETYEEYLLELNKQIDQRVAELKEEYSYIVEHEIEEEVNILGKKIIIKKIVREKVIPEVNKNIRLEPPDLCYLLAYINIKYIDYQSWQSNYEFNKEDTIEFFNDITEINEEVIGNNPVELTITSKIMDIEEVANLYFTSLYRGMFIASYYSLISDY